MTKMKKKSILIVEDEIIVAKLKQYELEQHNYIATVVNSGERAIQHVSHCDDVDLILMDIDLGSGIDGSEAARQILLEKDIPVIFHSSHTEPGIVEKTEKITSYGYVVKDSSPTVLDASIKMAFRLHSARMELEEHKNRLQVSNEKLESSNRELEKLNSALAQSRKEIKINENRFKNLFNNMRNGVAIYQAVDNGTDFIIKDLNKAGAVMEHVVRQDIIGRRVTEVFPGVKDFGLLDMFQRVWDSGNPEVLPLSQYKDSRLTGWRENYVFKLPSGEVVAVYEDFTEKKLLESDLFHTRSILEAAFTNSEAGIAIAEPPDGRLSYVNPAGLLIRGGDEDILVDDIDINTYVSSWHILYLDGTPYKPEDVPLARAVRKGETVKEEFIVRRDNYEDRYVLANAGPVFDENNSLIAGIVMFQDITDQKRIQKELEHSEKELKESQHLARLGSWQLDIATNQVTWSEELYRMYGFDPEGPPPSYNEQMKIFTPDSWDRLVTALDNTILTGEPYELELEMAREGESIGWMWVHGEAILDENGRTVSVWGAAQDISGRKKLEQSFIRSEELLNRSGEMARVGGWEVDFRTKRVYWTRAAKIIHEVPMDYEPVLDEALSFFPGESGEILGRAFDRAVKENVDYDLELDFVSARGNKLVVRTIGKAEHINGICERVFGVFQDITLQKKYAMEKTREESQFSILTQLHGMFNSSRDDLFDFIIEASKKLTGSAFSFFGLLSDDEKEMTIHSWSQNVMESCKVTNQPRHFSIEDSGIWGDCVRQRRTVIYNDYSENIPSKHGTPEGHVSITRFMAIPVFEGERIVAIGAVANREDPYEERDARAISTIYSRLWDVVMRNKAERSLHDIEWLLQRTVSFEHTHKAVKPEYGDVTELNTCRTIIDSMKPEVLASIAGDTIDLLETSVAVYEINGDYAIGLFSSGWCQLMDRASRRLCNTEDNAEALASGRWLCHECCWHESAGEAIKSGKPTDIKCSGGIHLYAEPIFADGAVIGTINIGYGNPPRDDKTLKLLSEKYQVAMDELRKVAQAYHLRPPYLVSLAKKRLHATALLIGKQVESRYHQHSMEERLKKLNCQYEFAEIVEHNETIEDIMRNMLPVLQKSWQYPEITGVRIILDNSVHGSDNFAETSWMQKADILVNGSKHGAIEVSYSQKRPEEGEGPFLHEERVLLDSLAERMGKIIERLSLKEALLESEERFKFILKGANDAPWDWDMVNDVLYYSPQWWGQLGYEVDELPADPRLWERLLHPDDKKRVDSVFREVLEDGEENYALEFNLRHKDGHYVPILSRGFVQYDDKGKPLRISGTNQDLTETKKMETALKESEKRFKAMHNASFGGITIHDKGKILDCNRGLSDITGYSHEELLGMDGLLLIAPDWRDYVMEKIMTGFDEPYEAEGLHKDGTVFPVRLHAKNIPYENREVRVTEFRDITDIKMTQEALKSALEEKQILLKELSHRIKNSFSIIQGLVQLNTNRIEDPLALAVLRDINTRVATMSQLYSLLHETGTAGKLELDMYCRRIIQSLREAYTRQARDVVFTEDYDSIQVTVKQASIIGMIVNEIVTNSLKYAFPDGRRGEINISLKVDDTAVMLNIGDNGIGLPDGFSLEGDSGFGIQLVQGMVNQLEGELTVPDSEGTEFIITIPRV